MNQIYLILIILLSVLGVCYVNSMTIKGPALTRYDPCGLGVIHFDRIKDNYWRGVLHFGLYSHLLEVDTKIYFEAPVVIYVLPNQTSFDAKRTTARNLLVRHVAPIPNHYIFHLEVVDYTSDAPVVTKFVLNGVTLCSDEIKAAHAVQTFDVSANYPEKPYAHVCGRRSMEHTELISMRTEAEAGDWPWHVALLVKDPVKLLGVYDCGGTIISRTAVLTAGHCIHKNSALLEPHRIAVIAGTNDYKDNNQAGRQVFIAQKLILHPSYVEELATSDLGVIKVAGFRFTEYVQPICLWGPHYDKTELFGKEATIAGFGSTENNTNADILRVLNTVVRNDSACIEFDPKVYTKLINEFTFCAGFGPNFALNPRNGDSGGGLIVSALQPDHMVSWMLRGVLSKCGVAPGGKLCDPRYYVVYTDVGPHYGWINHHAELEFRINVP